MMQLADLAIVSDANEVVAELLQRLAIPAQNDTAAANA